VIAASLVAPGGLVVAFEPDPRNFVYLKENSENLRNCDDVLLFNLALGAADGPALLYRSPRHSGDNRLSKTPGWQAVKINVARLDGVLGFLGARPVRLIKIDTQGAEVEVLTGVPDTLSRTDHLIVEYWPAGLHFQGHRGSELLELLAESGFALNMFREGEWGPVDEGSLPVSGKKPYHINLWARRKS
jgi:FkbM family methyltransferase